MIMVGTLKSKMVKDLAISGLLYFKLVKAALKMEENI